MRRLGLTLQLGDGLSRAELIELVRLAEERGYEAVFIPEAWGYDAVTTLTELAVQTRRIKLGTGILPIWSRTPALLAMTAASLDDLSSGRFILGLGISGPVVIQDWHGVPFERSIQRTREVIAIIRLALASDRVTYAGEIFQVQRFRLDFHPPRPRIPIYLASIGPKNLRLTGEAADGWLPIYCSPEGLASMSEEVAAGAKSAGRDPAEVEVAPYILACLSDDPEAGRRLVRRHLAYYIGGMGTFYFNLMQRSGFGPEAEAIQASWQRGDRAGAAAQVSDTMVEKLSLTGDREVCNAQLDQFQSTGATLPILMPPRGVTAAMVRRTIDLLAPDA
ncbi:MAG: LLM class flavin-dependent oxidoreductase [Candidatus Methylomirabilis sp.]